MFIDYLALMLVNLVAGLVLLAFYVYRGLDDPTQRHWASGFLMSGFVATVTGLHISLTWPLPGGFNVAFGELSVLFGVLLLGAGFAVALGWELFPVAVYAFFAGIVSIIVGVRLINLNLTQSPLVSGAGFIVVGLAGVLAAPALYFRTNRTARLLGAILLIIAALIFAFIGFPAYWNHIQQFAAYRPA